ncbi:MAG TPA: cytochrome c oxidase subunit II [Alphaproteobacteria bacterium]|nr:cytochrome c oxidase subunit II [Alphaproteobacteria bacterium]
MSNRWIVSIVLLVVAVGSVVFHLMTPWWSTPIASNWGQIDFTINLTFWITGVIYVAVILFMAWCVYKYRYRPDRRAEYEPENKKLEIWLTVGTTLGVAGLLAPGLIVWDKYVTVPKDASEVEVVGKQWEWSYRFPGKDGKLGKTAIRFINSDNPFGIDPKDPNGKDDILIEDTGITLPVGKSYKVLLRSIDVLHDFYVPQFRAKMDLVPGLVTYFWFTTTRRGTFDILCAELCGVGHHAMRGKVSVVSLADFQKYLGEQSTFEQSQKEARLRNEKKEKEKAAKRAVKDMKQTARN